jgi:hypothetical protein
MEARVLELGGDTLIFGERGRPERLDVPQEIVERRNELNSTEPNGSQPRIPKISMDQIPTPQGELWYYGAALRCKR